VVRAGRHERRERHDTLRTRRHRRTHAEHTPASLDAALHCAAAGTLYILPGTHLPPPGAAEPPPPPCDSGGGDDEERAVVVTVAAGAAVLLSDAVLHRSGANLSDAARRAWMPQLSAAPALRADGTPVALAVPLT
jgi:ectoine hydroxylase-related dioxygenase (phytanoyl-CoA dioxygenase family)